MSAPGTKLTFDTSGTAYTGDRVSIGCQVFTMDELRGSAQAVVRTGHRVSIRGAEGTVGELEMVTFAGTGTRRFREAHVRNIARNLRVTTAEEARMAGFDPNTLTPGTVVTATKGKKTRLFLLGEDSEATPLKARSRLTDDLDEFLEDYSEEDGWTWSVAGSQPAAAAEAAARNPNPATLRWQEGDQVIWIDRPTNTGPRTRDSRGRWHRQNGHRRTVGRRWEWTDQHYDRKIAEGKVRIITKGGVHFTYDA